MTLRFRRPEAHAGDLIFSWVLRGAAMGLPALLFSIAFFLFQRAEPAIAKFGWGFFTGSVWDPVQENFGALPAIYGTIVSSFLALLLAAPLSIGTALLLTEVLPRRLASAVGFLVEMLAAVPSVVYGLWGIFVLVPWLRQSLEPALARNLGWIPLFSGPPYGVGMLAAAIILAIMIAPTITSIAREVFRAIPRQQREAALALGATRWETMRLAVLRSGKAGVFGAAILGLGRALGETMAVTMVIGNRPSISASLLEPAQTLSSVLANEYAEAASDLHLAALVEIGLALFAVTFAVNAFARLFLWRRTLGRSAR
ncbi:MAG: phosphate ABC transporter permease subunit PstC [Oligoflexia bacterium]|nr:phosphate ABC transporter permease subunit PstC [Oligoflexia bacterium]